MRSLLWYCVVLSMGGSSVIATDWPHWRGPHFNDSVQHPGIFDGGYNFEVSWKQQVGSGYSAIVVINETMVTLGSMDGSDYVVALHAESGQPQWKTRIAHTFPGRDGAVDGACSTPALTSDAVYALGPHGDLLALDLADGSPKWRRHLVVELGAVVPQYGFTTSPLVDGDKLFVAAGGPKAVFLCLDRHSGETLWAVGEDVINFQTPIITMLAQQKQLVAAGDRGLYGLDLNTGKVLWQQNHGGGEYFHKLINPVKVGDNGLFLKFKRSESKLLEVSRQGENTVLNQTMTSPHFKKNFNIPIYHKGYLYAHSGDFLSCISASDGSLMWKSRAPGNGWLMMLNDHLVVLTKQGSLHVAKASAQAYQELAKIQVLLRATWTPPSFAKGLIYVRESSGLVAAVRPGIKSMQAADHDTPNLPLNSSFGKMLARVEKARKEEKQPLVDEYFAKVGAYPITESNGWVHIVYRGKAKDMGLRCDLTEFKHQTQMNALKGTDLFHASFKLEEDGHFSYQLIKDFDENMIDPLNPNRVNTLYFGEWSECFMPAHRGPQPVSANPLEGSLKTMTFSDKSGASRGLTIYLPKDYAQSEKRYPTLYVYYGKRMLEDGQMAQRLDQLLAQNKVEPHIAVFVNTISRYEYARSQKEAYAQMVIDELVPFIDHHFRTLASRNHRAVLGTEEAGYGALMVALRHDSPFGSVAAQSSWPIGAGDKALFDQIKSFNNLSVRVDLTWGSYDLYSPSRFADVPGFNRALHALLKERGVHVRARQLPDGSDMGSWRLQWADILPAILPLNSVNPVVAWPQMK